MFKITYTVRSITEKLDENNEQKRQSVSLESDGKYEDTLDLRATLPHAITLFDPKIMSELKFGDQFVLTLEKKD